MGGMFLYGSLITRVTMRRTIISGDILSFVNLIAGLRSDEH
jgi:hypothetical protein